MKRSTPGILTPGILTLALATFVLPMVLFLHAGCDFFDDQSCFEDRKLQSADGQDESFHVGMRFRIFVHDADDIPSEGVDVTITYWKVHCDGKHSVHFEETGTTSDNGLFSTQLQAVYRTFKIDTTEDEIAVEVYARKAADPSSPMGNLWVHHDFREYNVSALQSLPLSNHSGGAYRERTLLFEDIVMADP